MPALYIDKLYIDNRRQLVAAVVKLRPFDPDEGPMKPTGTFMCSSCHALRWAEDWRENRDEMMSIVLGPCGHTIEREARLEWAVHARPASARVATS
jgi:hypothetical protein